MPFVDTKDRIRISFEEAGSGLPVVFVHGWAMSSRVWSFQSKLAEDFRLITVDLRGHGRSSTSGTIGLKSLASDMTALFECLDLRAAILVGWSLGALVALQSFSELKERLAALALVGGTPRFTAEDGYDAGLSSREVRGLQVGLMRDYEKTMGGFFRRMFAQGELSREQENRIAREIVMGSRLPEPAVALQGLAILAEEDLRNLLPAVDRPVLLIHGEEDSICPVAAAHLLARDLPDPQLRVFAGTGHAPFLSKPHEFNEELRTFLRKIHGTD